jgi:hypothetical protein
LFSERATVVSAAPSSASAAIATVGNAIAAKRVEDKPGSNSYVRPITATNGPRLVDGLTNCANEIIDSAALGLA